MLVILFFNVLLEFICFHAGKWFQVLLFNSSNSIYQVFLCNINDLPSAVWFQITYNNSLQMIDQLYLTHRQDTYRQYESGSKWTWELWQRRGIPQSPELQKCNLIIRCCLVLFPGHSLWKEGGGGLNLLLKCSWRILLTPLTKRFSYHSKGMNRKFIHSSNILNGMTRKYLMLKKKGNV